MSTSGGRTPPQRQTLDERIDSLPGAGTRVSAAIPLEDSTT